MRTVLLLWKARFTWGLALEKVCREMTGEWMIQIANFLYKILNYNSEESVGESKVFSTFPASATCEEYNEFSEQCKFLIGGASGIINSLLSGLIISSPVILEYCILTC